MTKPRALITGITGQDGSYLAEWLLAQGYEVHGLIRRSSSFNTGRIDHVFDRLHLHYGDATDGLGMLRTILTVKPREVYNLAAQSHVKVSFDQPLYTGDTVALGAAALLEAVRTYQDTTGETVRFYQASSSEMFGNAPAPQSETTPFKPCSPYAAAKLHAHELTRVYRESYGLHASCGILFNHDSPRRGETFFTRKITRAATRIKLGLQETVHVGNLDAQRDIGFAGDYVQAMWLMLQQDEPDDYVIGTGWTHTMRQFAEWAFDAVGLHFADHAVFDERYLRPNEVNCLQADPAKARTKLGWQPIVSVNELAEMMIESDLELARKEALCESC